MANDYFTKSGSPSTGSQGSSAVMRSEFASVESAFDKLPNLNNRANEVVFVNTGGTGLTSQNANTARTSLGLSIGNNVQAWDADLDTLAALDATTGVLIRSAANNFVRRVVEGTANEVTVTNGNGVAGNITLSLPSALTFSGKTVTGGTFSSPTISNAAALTTNNATITGGSVSGITDIAVADGGTGASSLSQNNLLAGNGTGQIIALDPGLSGQVLTSQGSGNLPVYSNAATAASQAEMEAASDLTKFASPGRQHFHPGHPKCWAFVTVSGGTPTLESSYNITSITDVGAGNLTVTIATDFSTANWAHMNTLTTTVTEGTNGDITIQTSQNKLAGSIGLLAYKLTFSSGSLASLTTADPSAWSFAGFGDQA